MRLTADNPDGNEKNQEKELHTGEVLPPDGMHPDYSPRQQLSRFRSYYLIPTVIFILVIIAAILILSRIFGKREENLLYVAVFDNVMDTTAKEEAEAEILNVLTERRANGDETSQAEGTGQSDHDYTVELDDSFSLSDGKDAERLLVLSSNHACDVIIGNIDLVRAYAGYGYLEDLDEVLPSDLLAEMKESLMSLPGYLDDGSNAVEDTETGQGEEKNYALSLTGSRLLESLGCSSDGVYAGIVLECANPDDAVWFLEKLESGTEWN